MPYTSPVQHLPDMHSIYTLFHLQWGVLDMTWTGHHLSGKKIMEYGIGILQLVGLARADVRSRVDGELICKINTACLPILNEQTLRDLKTEYSLWEPRERSGSSKDKELGFNIMECQEEQRGLQFETKVLSLKENRPRKCDSQKGTGKTWKGSEKPDNREESRRSIENNQFHGGSDNGARTKA